MELFKTNTLRKIFDHFVEVSKDYMEMFHQLVVMGLDSETLKVIFPASFHPITTIHIIIFILHFKRIVTNTFSDEFNVISEVEDGRFVPVLNISPVVNHRLQKYKTFQ